MNSTNSTLNYTDSAFNVYMSYITFCGWTLMFFINVLMTIIRRNHQPVKARFVPVVVIHQFLMWVGVVLPTVRIVVGRISYPCMIYTFSYCFALGIFLPHIVRCYRLIVIFKLSAAKVNNSSENSVRTQNLISFFSRAISPPVLIAFVLIMVAFQVAMWLFISGLQSITQPEFFSFNKGCGLGGLLYFILALGGIYAVVDFILICFLIRGVRDAYGIRYEVFIASAVYTLALIIFGVLYLIPYWQNVIEIQFAEGWFLITALMVDSILSCTLPWMLSFRRQVINETTHNDIEMTLANEKYRAILKKYAVESFCPESICK